MKVLLNGRELYGFNSENGTLRVSTDDEGLENLLKLVGDIPQEGKDVYLPAPFTFPESFEFRGVKRIVSNGVLGYRHSGLVWIGKKGSFIFNNQRINPYVS